MNQPDPLLTSSSTVLWLKVLLTALSLVALYLRYKKRSTRDAAPESHSFGVKLLVVFAVLFSFAVFHSFGDHRGRGFVHYGEMFHYYLGPKYFQEVGYYGLYNAVIAADAEQDNALAGLPFYTNLKSYKNASRETALKRVGRVKKRFSEERWSAFKEDVGFFKQATAGTPALSFFLMDHGYNASPVSTTLLGLVTNLVPVTQLFSLALLDVLLVGAMIAIVFHTFGLAMGALFSVYFFVNILNDQGYISGGLLRYDWLFCVVTAVCLLEKGRRASAAIFLTTAAMLKVFPAVLFYGIGVTIVRQVTTRRTVDKTSIRFVVAAAATALLLFALPALYLGSVLQPWQQFAAKTALHDRGVYVNHLGLRGVLLFEPSHLSLDQFVETYASESSGDLVRHWQDVKEREFKQKRPLVLVCSLLVLAGLTVIIWRRKACEVESVLWLLPLIYVASYPSHYYYAFLCLFILLFFRRPNSLESFVPLCLLLLFNVAALVTDSFGPSPIVFFTVVNGCLCVCLAAIVLFELFLVFRSKPEEPVAPAEPAPVPGATKTLPKREQGRRKPRTLRRAWSG
jgi:hypothetical protein